MDNPSTQNKVSRNRLIDRLDRGAREMNAFLLVLAMIRDAAPSVARGSVDPSDAARRAASLGPSVTVLAPTKPEAQVTGR